MKKYDLHIHTIYSPCSMLKPERILKIAKKSGLNGIAITDHGSIKGALKTKSLNKDKDFEVIIGEEIKTSHGELLAYYVREEIKNDDLFEVIDQARSQDCILAVAHPFRVAPWQQFRYPLKKLTKKLDAIETFNSRNILSGNAQAKIIAKKLNFACIGSSDAHVPSDIAKGYTLFEGSLRESIKKRATIAKGTILYGPISILMASFNKRIIAPFKVNRI